MSVVIRSSVYTIKPAYTSIRRLIYTIVSLCSSSDLDDQQVIRKVGKVYCCFAVVCVMEACLNLLPSSIKCVRNG